MSTVASVLNGVRYDLRNYADIDFDSVQLLHYLNRAINILDYTLSSHNSDWILNKSDSVTLAASATSATVPTGCFNVREVWYGDKRKENLNSLTVYYDKLSTEITAESDTMPYEGRFDNAIRETVVLMCTAKKYKKPYEADAMYQQIFDAIVHSDALHRRYKKKNYRLDF